jgi:hypothetical protein
MFDNPAVLLGLMCLCFPGLLPIIATFFIARNFDVSIQKRKPKIRSEDIEV